MILRLIVADVGLFSPTLGPRGNEIDNMQIVIPRVISYQSSKARQTLITDK